MNKFKTSIATLALATVLAPAAQAQMSYYYGGGLTYSNAVSLPNPSATSSDASTGDLFGIGLTSGVRFDRGNLFYGAELDADINIGGAMTFIGNGLSCADGFASSPYICSQNATVRARAVFGTDISGFEVFGTVGYAVMAGRGATGGDGRNAVLALGGLTYGIGAQRPFGAGKLRAEIIWDDLSDIVANPSNSPFQTDWTATTAKVSYIIEF